MNKTARGFTLVELLVVIAIIAILAAVVLVIINPAELTRRGRDATRLSDLANLAQAINVAVQQESNGVNYLCADVIPSTSGATWINACRGISTDTDGGKADGTGWVKADLKTQTVVSVPALPSDPKNDATYHYAYCSNGTSGWEMNTVLESIQQIPKMTSDGGDETTKYEVGSNLNLLVATLPGAGGVGCTY